MNTMFAEIGVFNIALVLMVYLQIYSDTKKYDDCKLFGRLLIAIIAILGIDSIGWLIDGKPLMGQIWITTVIDGLDLFVTSLVCWCWAKYALYIANSSKRLKMKWYKDFLNYLIILQAILVICSQIFDFYYYVDAYGVYHRSSGYFIHTAISLFFLFYSSFLCIMAYFKEHKKEQLFVTLIVFIPVLGNVIQLIVYGFPTVWLCMVFMIIAVYIHIQNERTTVERKEQYKALRKALCDAQEANIAKTEFFSRISHDMRTPMNGILGMIELSRDSKDMNEIQDNLNKARAAGEYMLSLINDTLDLQRLESNKLKLNLETVYFKDYFNNIFSIIEVSAKQKNIDFKVEYNNFVLDRYARIDKMRVKQIFSNLLSNAIKFTPDYGTVQVSLETINVEKNILHNKLVVRDSGVGMSQEFITNRLFKPYSQENNEMTSELTGSGLGMAITKNLVDIMGGRIEVESELGEGTTYTIYTDMECVPYDEAQKEHELKLVHRNNGIEPLNDKCVLLCEDNALNAEITKRILAKAGCNVEWAENGKIGVDMFDKSQTNYYDAVLMDIRMPEMSGIDAAEAIRALDRADGVNVPIIAMSANAYPEDIKKSLDAGMNGHLAKPVDAKLLFETLIKYID